MKKLLPVNFQTVCKWWLEASAGRARGWQWKFHLQIGSKWLLTLHYNIMNVENTEVAALLLIDPDRKSSHHISYRSYFLPCVSDIAICPRGGQLSFRLLKMHVAYSFFLVTKFVWETRREFSVVLQCYVTEAYLSVFYSGDVLRCQTLFWLRGWSGFWMIKSVLQSWVCSWFSGLSLNLQLSPGSNRAIVATATTQETMHSGKSGSLIKQFTVK